MVTPLPLATKHNHKNLVLHVDDRHETLNPIDNIAHFLIKHYPQINLISMKTSGVLHVTITHF